MWVAEGVGIIEKIQMIATKDYYSKDWSLTNCKDCVKCDV